MTKPAAMFATRALFSESAMRDWNSDTEAGLLSKEISWRFQTPLKLKMTTSSGKPKVIAKVRPR